MRREPLFWFAAFSVAWVAFWMVAAVVDHFTHFIGAF